MAAIKPTEANNRYHIYLDYAGFMVDPRTYRANPAPLFGTKFSTGRTAYSNLDFWQVGAMTDFSKGINQLFQNDPSQYYLSEGLDVSVPGEISLERDLEDQAVPGAVGHITAHYRASGALWLGTSFGDVLRSTDGVTFTEVKHTGEGRVYGFYEFKEIIIPTTDTNPDGTPTVAGRYYAQQLDGLPAGATLVSVMSLYICKGAGYVWKMSTKTYTAADGSTGTVEVWYELDGTQMSRMVKDLYFTMIDSDYAYGMFNDGVRQSVDGETWTPEPPDPLWQLPSAEGIALNTVSIPRGFLIGAQRGLYIFVGGGSGMNLWSFPESGSTQNFQTLCKVGAYGLFNVDGQGLWFTEGAQVYPTSLHWLAKPKAIVTASAAAQAGWDVFATVKDADGNWYLARCNMTYQKVPQFWWIVKKLAKEPCYISVYDPTKIFIHYIDGTASVYDKDDGPYQSSGYITTSLLDEGMILLQKQYRSISGIFSKLQSTATLSIGYALKESNEFTTKVFTPDGVETQPTYTLPNPTLSDRLLIKVTMGTADTSVSPVMTDLCWKYFLERPKSDATQRRMWNFSVLAEDLLQKMDENIEEEGLQEPRSRQDLIDQLWEISDKRELLNYVGMDNISKRAFELKYVGSGTSCLIKIDQTNRKLTSYVSGVPTDDISIDFTDMTVEALIDAINAIDNYQATIDQEVPQNQAASTLVPVKDVDAKGGMDVYWGNDVHVVIVMPQYPAQMKIKLDWQEIEGVKIGSDRISVGVREA